MHMLIKTMWVNASFVFALPHDSDAILCFHTGWYMCPSFVYMHTSIFHFSVITSVLFSQLHLNLICIMKNSGPSCSKLMMLLVNDSLKLTSIDTQIC